MKFVMLINLNLLTIANSSLINVAEHELSLLINISYLLAQKISCSAELSMKKVLHYENTPIQIY